MYRPLPGGLDKLKQEVRAMILWEDLILWQHLQALHGEQYAAEHSRPFGGAVAGVGHDRRPVAASSRPALTQVVDPVFEARGTMPDLALSLSGRKGGARRHPLSLSCADAEPRNERKVVGSPALRRVEWTGN